MTATYEIKDFYERFKTDMEKRSKWDRFEGPSEIAPLLETVFEEWVKQIQGSVVSDIVKASCSERNSVVYMCVIDSKIVQIKTKGMHVDTGDEDEIAYSYENVSFHGTPESEKLLHENFSAFIKNKSLDEIVSAYKKERR